MFDVGFRFRSRKRKQKCYCLCAFKFEIELPGDELVSSCPGLVVGVLGFVTFDSTATTSYKMSRSW